MRKITYFIGFVLLTALSACHSASKEDALDSRSSDTSSSNSERVLSEQDVHIDSFDNQAAQSGILGVFDVPEMLTMVILDSAKMEEVALKRTNNYATIEKEMNLIGAEMEGSPGSIYYNNDPKNFKFESVMLIKDMPKTSPAKSKIVVLEATKMLICNYFGPYEDLHKSYKEMNDYCKKNHLEQSGPMREFFIMNPTLTPDSRLWLTRIMLPVIEKK